MKQIVIAIPFVDAARLTPLWGVEEKFIDFAHENDRAERCTMAFAAMELQQYLVRMFHDTQIRFACSLDPIAVVEDHKQTAAIIIELMVRQGQPVDGFSLEPIARGVRVVGFSRRGLMYGAYELLRMQGWRWYAPGSAGETPPAPAAQLVLPRQVVHQQPSMPVLRGLEFESASEDSVDFILWMSRNRLDCCGHRPLTAPLAKKLGLLTCVGGHLFDEVLRPDRPLSSGQTLWEAHPEWFGLPPGGDRSKEKAVKTQFCMAQPALLNYLWQHLLGKLQTDWKGTDLIAISGFDTWGTACHCSQCRSAGNGSDQLLSFAAAIQRRMEESRASGELAAASRLLIWCYEGTDTLQPPDRPVPRELVAGGAACVFWPINRCYAHNWKDPGCPENTHYRQALDGWVEQGQLPMIVGEYYNVSKYEDLPLPFLRRVCADLPAFHRRGVRGMTYMHVPFVNWGQRTLLQNLYAQLSWDVDTDIEAYCEEYFRRWYESDDGRLPRAYELIDQAWQLISQWRAWSEKSILSRLIKWDGARPQTTMPVDSHFKSAAEAILAGREAVVNMREAMKLMEHFRRKSRLRMNNTAGTSAVNPRQLAELESRRRIVDRRLGDDRRLLRYGIDVMTVMTELLAYHEALAKDDSDEAEASWKVVEQAADALDSYFLPIGYEWPGPGLVSKDALTRSQLDHTIDRCRLSRPKLASLDT
jgi:hypothetical protein